MFNFLRRKNKKTFPAVSAVIAAAGNSSRMRGENKLLMELCGMPVLVQTLMAFEQCPLITNIVLAAGEDSMIEYADLASVWGVSKLKKAVKGGSTRAESVYKAICETDKEAEFIAVHDAARPLITAEDIEKVCLRAFETSCAIAASPMRDTVKRVSDERVEGTVNRDEIYFAETPQVADRALIFAALKAALDENLPITDESMALERLGAKPAIVDLGHSNMKITYPEDIYMASVLMEARAEYYENRIRI